MKRRENEENDKQVQEIHRVYLKHRKTLCVNREINNLKSEK